MFNPLGSGANLPTTHNNNPGNRTNAIKVGKLSNSESKTLVSKGKEWASEAEKVDQMLQETHKDLCNIARQVADELRKEGNRLHEEAERLSAEADMTIADADRKIADSNRRIADAEKKSS